jgi:hypothetical protein
MARKSGVILEVVQEVSFVAQQSKKQRPDEVVTVTLAPRTKKSVTWAADVVGNESCKHCKKCANRNAKLGSRSSPTRRYLTSLVNHLLA